MIVFLSYKYCDHQYNVALQRYLQDGSNQAQLKIEKTVHLLNGKFVSIESSLRILALDQTFRRALVAKNFNDNEKTGEFLEGVSGLMDVDIVWILNKDGICIASSNYESPNSFVGVDYSDRKYFTDAMHGGIGRQVAVGRRTKFPGLFYSAPIKVGNQIIGVIALKRNRPQHTEFLLQDGVMVTDPNGVVIISKAPELMFKVAAGGRALHMSAAELQREYATDSLTGIPVVSAKVAKHPDLVYFNNSRVPAIMGWKDQTQDGTTLLAYTELPELDQLRINRVKQFTQFLTIGGLGSIMIMFLHGVINRYERKFEHQQRRISLLTLAIEQSPNMVVITDLYQRVTNVNGAFIRLTGFTAEQALGRKPSELLRSGKTPRETYDDLRQCLDSGRPWRGQFYNHRADGTEFITSATIWPIKNELGDLTNYLSLQEDITDQVTTQAALTAALDTANKASRSKSEFLATMSHEIRTPMNAIIGFTRGLLRDVKDPKVVSRLNKIALSSNHLLRIINDILDMSKIEAGKMIRNQENFSLKQLLSEVEGQVKDKAEAQGLELVMDISSEIPDLLCGDALRISQCLLNYAGNAVTFTNKGSVTFRITLESRTSAGYLIRFTVEDTGIGIGRDALDRLFLPFEQADKSTTRQFGGTGLGLALNKNLAELMGGSVGVDSTLGKGSSFWFTAMVEPALDLRAKARPETKPPENAPLILSRNYAQAKLMVVEDVAINREIIMDMMEEVGIKPDFAENGEVAVTMARQTHYHLIFMDMQMPVMDGMKATEIIRSIPLNAKTPIVALTANAFLDDRKACFDAGMDDFLSKPIVPELLFATMVKWLETQPMPAASGPPAPAVGNVLPESAEDPFARIQLCLGNISDIDLGKIPMVKSKPLRFIGYFKGYAANFADVVPQFQASLESGKREEALRLAHSLKGTSGQLGIVGIVPLASKLEDAVKAGDDTESLLALADELAPRLSVICAAFSALDGNETV